MIHTKSVYRPLLLASGVALCFWGGSAAAQDSLFIDAVGNVGVGTGAPNQPIHVTRSDGTSRVLVEETSAAVERRRLLELSNNGGPAFLLNNTATGNRTEFTLFGGDDSFSINHLGSGSADFRLFRNGNLNIAGTLSQGSDVNSKTDIAPVDGQALLDKLAELPISTWRYKSDGPDTMHLGPMAQDFHSVFKLGNDDTRLAPGDMAGVALASMKVLSEQTISQAQLIEQQSAQIEALKSELLALRAETESLRSVTARIDLLEERLSMRVAQR